MSDFERAGDRGTRRHPGRRRLGRGADGLEPGRRPATRSRSSSRQGAEDVAATVRFAAEQRPQGQRRRERGTAPPRLARPGGDDPDQDGADAGHRRRPRGEDRPGRGRRASALELGEAAQPARALLDAGLLPRRRRDRLHARRRAELAGPQARLRLQPRAGDRAGHRRRGAAHRRRRERRRPLLGAARRGRWLRDRHRAAPRPAADRRDLRRGAALPRGGRRRRRSHLPRLGGRGARGGHLDRPLHHPAADPRRPRAAARHARC